MGNTLDTVTAKDKFVANTDTDIFSLLNADCWMQVMSYLDVASQLSLAQTSERICGIFQDYAKINYKHVGYRITQTLSDEQLNHLLQLIGDQVLSYTTPKCDNFSFDSPQAKKRTRMFFGLTAQARLQRKLYKRHFEAVVRNCPHLEYFNYDELKLSTQLNYEIILQLPRLKHLRFGFDPMLRPEFLNTLAKKPGAPLETLILWRSMLHVNELEKICSVESITKLDVLLSEVGKPGVFVKNLLQLHQLNHLKLYVPLVTDNQVIELAKGLPNLRSLHLTCLNISTVHIAEPTREWMRTNGHLLQNLKVCVECIEYIWELVDRPGEGILLVRMTRQPDFSRLPLM